MTGKEAESMLRQNDSLPDTCYITRYNKLKGKYKITVSTRQGSQQTFRHYNFVDGRDSDMHKVEGATTEFNDIFKLLLYYETNPLSGEVENGIGQPVSHDKECFDTSLDTNPKTAAAAAAAAAAEKEKFSVAVPTYKMKGITEHSSYHGVMSQSEAEAVLTQHEGGCYLTRSNEDGVNVLSVKPAKKPPAAAATAGGGVGGESGTAPAFEHFEIKIHPREGSSSEYEIAGTKEKFKDISELLDFYHDVPLSHTVTGIGDFVGHSGSQKPPPYDTKADHNQSIATTPSERNVLESLPIVDTVSVDEEKNLC